MLREKCNFYYLNQLHNKMKNIKINLYCGMAIVAMLAFVSFANAQDAKPRPSPHAVVTQRIGVDTDITIDYSRPGVKGRKIWGELVPYGMNPGNKYSKDQPYPWRAGANENTVIAFNKDLLIEGQKIPAGKYGVHMLPGEKEFKIMFNKKSDGWGSYSYNADENALVVTVKPVACEHTEWLEFGFEDLSANSATAYLKWEKKKIPFKVQLAE